MGLAGIGVFLEQRGRERYCVVNSLQKRGSAEREGTLRIGDAVRLDVLAGSSQSF